jgi:hypothetical protein
MLNKILYIGSLHNDTTSNSRFNGLLRHCNSIDTIELAATHTITAKIRTKFLKIPSYSKTDQLRTRLEDGDYDLVWVDKPTYFNLTEFKKIRSEFRNTKFAAHITDDLVTVRNYCPDICEILKLFDYVFSPNKKNIAEIPEIKFHYNEIGFDHEKYIYSSKPITERSKCISFVGHFEPAYSNELQRISSMMNFEEVQLMIFGSGWWKYSGYYIRRQPAIKTGWIDMPQMLNVYNDSKMGVGLYSELNRNLTSGRIFELAAMGTPLLMRGNNLIREVIGENFVDLGKEFSIRAFMNIIQNDEYLERIRIGAYQSLMRNRCTWSDRVSEAVAIIQK